MKELFVYTTLLWHLFDLFTSDFVCLLGILFANDLTICIVCMLRKANSQNAFISRPVLWVFSLLPFSSYKIYLL